MMRAAIVPMIAVLAATPALAQQPICMPIEILAELLRREHRETPRQAGTAERAEVVLFATEDGSTWTLVAIGADGKACIGASGVRWRATGRGA